MIKRIVFSLVVANCLAASAQYKDSQILYSNGDTVVMFEYNDPTRLPKLRVALLPFGLNVMPSNANVYPFFHVEYRLSNSDLIVINPMIPQESMVSYKYSDLLPLPKRNIILQGSWQHIYAKKPKTLLRKRVVYSSTAMYGSNTQITRYKMKIPIETLKWQFLEAGFFYQRNNEMIEYDSFRINQGSQKTILLIPGYSVGNILFGSGLIKTRSYAISTKIYIPRMHMIYFSSTFKIFSQLIIPIANKHIEYLPKWDTLGPKVYNRYYQKAATNSKQLTIRKPGILVGLELQLSRKQRMVTSLRTRVGILPYPKEWKAIPNREYPLIPINAFQYYEFGISINYNFGKYVTGFR